MILVLHRHTHRAPSQFATLGLPGKVPGSPIERFPGLPLLERTLEPTDSAMA